MRRATLLLFRLLIKDSDIPFFSWLSEKDDLGLNFRLEYNRQETHPHAPGKEE